MQDNIPFSKNTKVMIMNKFEKLLKKATDANISVYEYNLGESNLEGLYYDNNIALSNKIETTNRKACIIAEELGHHYTSSGNILNTKDIGSMRQEHRARRWAYDIMVKEQDIKKAISAGCREIWEIAEYLDIDEQFLRDALVYYGYLT